jgi:flagellar M-ring protein FliF
MPAGIVKKMSVAVLVDQAVTWEKDQKGYKKVLVPPAPETLKIIREQVAGVTGFNPDRGDQLTIDTLPFENTLLLEPPDALGPRPAAPVSPGGFVLRWDRHTMMVGGGALAGVLVLGFLLLLLARRGPAVGPVEATGPTELPRGAAAPAGLPGTDVEQQLESQLAQRDALQQKMDAQALTSLKLAPVITKKAEVLAKHLREKITKDPDISAQILRTWIREEEP